MGTLSMKEAWMSRRLGWEVRGLGRVVGGERDATLYRLIVW
jgi:hypothetical protein